MKKLLSLPPNLVGCFHEVTGYDRKEWFCSHDPVGRKLGSGGGTAWLLEECFRKETGDRRKETGDRRQEEGDRRKERPSSVGCQQRNACCFMLVARVVACLPMRLRERSLPPFPCSVGNGDNGCRRICYHCRSLYTNVSLITPQPPYIL